MNKQFDSQLFRNQGQLFLTKLTSELTTLGLPAQHLVSDHLCFRVETMEQYLLYKSHILNMGILLTEAVVNGRPIATFRLREGFRTNNHLVDLVELPSPKSGAGYSLGFEHAEFVIQESFESFAAKFPKLEFLKSGQKNINPELCLNTSVGQAKFHYVSLARVIEIELGQVQDIIFDFDGTIVESREAIHKINRVVFSEALGRPVSLEESKENFHSEFTKLFESFNLHCPDKKKIAVSRWSELSEEFNYNLFDEIFDLLVKLSSRKCRLHLWTARDQRSAMIILKQHGLESFFNTMSFATETDSKPHSKSLTFDWMRASKNSIVVIGDSPTDMLGAKNIGALAVAAVWDPYAHHNSLIAAGADLHFSKIGELDSWLTNKIKH